jgi:DNA-binding NtrC family response regulator
MSQLLLVDDDTALARVVAEALELRLGTSHQLKVHVRSSWEGAHRCARELDRLDVLLADYHLGPHTGTELCQALRELYPDMGALLYTGKATALVDAEARACAMEVLWKPARLGVLTEVVVRLLDASGAADR